LSELIVMKHIEIIEKSLLQAIYLYGDDTQTDILIEEMSELTKAIIKSRRSHTHYKSANIIEELADVIICIEQLRLIARKDFMGDFDKHLQNLVNDKMIRLERRMMEDTKSRGSG